MEIIDDIVKLIREDEFKASGQITLGKLIQQLEACEDQTAKVFFDFAMYSPVVDDDGAYSYRGYYDELALNYQSDYNLAPTVESFLEYLKTNVLDKEFYGYKGGEFIMHKDVPVWVSGSSSVMDTAAKSVTEDVHRVVINTFYVKN